MMDMKRIAALLMALCLVFQMVPAPAGATEAPAIAVSSAEAYPGNSCYIDVDAAGLSNLASLDLEIYYDSEILTLSSVTNGILLADSLASVNDETVGVVKLSAAWLSGVNGSGRILRLQFQVNSDAPAGSSRILVAVGDAHDVNLNHVHISGGTGTVTVPERPDNMGNFQVGTYFPNGSVFQQGDTVTVVMTNSGSPSFASADFKLEYDSELFRVESVKLRNALANEGAVYSVNTDIAGIAKVSYASVEPVSSYFLMDFVLTVIADVDATSTVTVSAADVYTVDLIPYTPASGSGTVTLEKKAVEPDYPDLYLTDLPTTVGQEGTSLLILEEGAGVAAADFTVKYDPAVYQCLGVTASKKVSENGGMLVLNPTYDKGVIKFSFIMEKGLDIEMELVEIQWKCLASPEEHTEVLTGGTGIVDADFKSIKLDLIPFGGCIFDAFRLEPTCTADGEEGLMCYACGEKKDTTVLPATGHHYGAVVTPPTCTEQGYTTYTCPDCGDSYVDDYVAILPHAYESVVTPPTCTEQGFTTYTCPDCGHSYVDDYTAATGHSFGEWYTVVAATCTETGIRKHDCRNCDHSETEELEILGHAYENGICIRCGAPESYLEEGKCGDTLYWRMGEDGTLTVFGTGAMYNFNSSETGPWNAYKDTITKVTVGEGATTIGQNAFRSYTAVVAVRLPGSLQALNNSCFYGCSGLVSVELTGELKRIDSYAFSSCNNLETVTLPEGLDSIGQNAFYSCSKLKGIVIPDTVTVMGNYAFSNCYALEYANIPAGVTTLSTMVFYSCQSLKEITIPDTVEVIGDYAFSSCKSLTNMTVPAGVTTIGRRAFLNCSALQEIYIYSTDCTIADEAVFDTTTILLCYEGSTAQAHAEKYGVPYCAAPSGTELGHVETAVVTAPTCTEQGFTTYSCSRCGNVRVADYTDILPHAYESVVTAPTCTAKGYTTYTCPDCGDSYVDDYVDMLPHAYESVVTAPTCTAKGYTTYTCPDCGDSYVDDYVDMLPHAYEGVVTAPTCTAEGYTTYTCPDCGDSYVDDYVDATGHSYGQWYISVEPTCTETGVRSRDCENCDHIESETEAALGHAYENGICIRCGAPESYLEEGKCGDTLYWRMGEDGTLTIFGTGAMYDFDYSETGPWNGYKDSITKVLVQEGATSVGQSAFRGYKAITELVLPDTLQILNYGCFYACEGLTCVELTGDLKQIGNSVFSNCSNLESVTLPEGLESIGDQAFSSCNNLKGIVIPDSVSALGSFVFSNCRNLEYANIPEGVTELGTMAFFSCRSLREIVIPESMKSIGDYAFRYCDALTSVVIPAGVDSVNRWAFDDCKLLEEIYVYSTHCTFAEESLDAEAVVFCYEESTAHIYAVENGLNYCAVPEGEALGHSRYPVVTEPTCTEDGFTTWYCAYCGAAYTSDPVAALGHDFGEWETTKEATCTEDGEQRRDCGRCDHYKTEVLTKLGHDYKGAATDPTCTEKGYTTYTCSRCDDSYVSDYVDALGHDMGEWETTVEATCTEDGQQRRDCSRCDHFETQAVSKLGHDYSSAVTAPTCTAQGYTTHTCERCGDTYQDSHVDALGHDYIAVVTAPTCLDRGYTTYTCSRCGHSYVDNYVPATGHSMGEWYEDTAPTCTETGVDRRDCANCDHYETRTSAALGHEFGEWYTAAEATCTEDGQQRRDCSRCDHYETRAVSKLGHDYEAVVTAPTCTEAGYTTHTCTRCDDSYVDSTVAALGHSYGQWYTVTEPGCTTTGKERRDCSRCDAYATRTTSSLDHDYVAVVTEPTCTMQGYTTHTCSRCGDSYTDSYVWNLGHDYGDWYTVKEATCTEAGQQRRDCSRCSQYETQGLSALDHDYKSVVTEPTCTEQGYTTHTCSRCADTYTDSYVPALKHSYEAVVTAPTCLDKGYTTYTCSRCGHSYVGAYVDALGHDMGEWETTVEATCTEDGAQRRECSRCDHSETQVIEKLGHDYKSVVTDPTCTEEGYTTHTCSRCGDTYVDSYVEAAGHSMGEWYVVKAADCTETGVDRRDCANCDHYETRTTQALDHDYVHTVVDPTCTEEGYTVHTCQRCGESFVSDYVDALGHDMGEWKTTEEATCTEDGEQRRDCGRCDHYETQVLPMLGHDYKSVVTAPTCTEDGYTTHTCTRCGDTYTDTPVAALGHNFGEWETTKEATCTEDGLERRDCSRCGHFETQVVSKLGHDYKGVVTAPTCTEDGYTTHTCSRCGDSYKDSYVDALGHSYDAVVTAPTCLDRGYTTYTCSRCGHSYVDNYVPATGHSMGNWYEDTAATCTETGVDRRDCANCDHYETRVSAALGHDYDGTVTAPTCTEQGYTTYTCSRCDDRYVSDYVKALGHAWDEGVVTVEPTEESTGERLYTCERCGETKTEVIPELEHVHNYSSAVTAPTCTEQGYTTYTCRCGDSYKADYVDALGHDYKAVVTAPTCTEDGYTTHTCSRCDDSYVDTPVAALGHAFGEWETTVEATCTEDGQQRRDCSRCDHFETQAVSKLGHDYVAVVTDPTCTEQGYTTHTCSRCADTYTDSYVPALKHNYEAVVTVPTCLDKGYTTYTCTRCGDSYVSDYVNALGHAFGEWETTKEATCTEDGQQRRDCTRCDHFETQVVSKLGHDYKSVVTDPTCTEDGYTTHTCSRCADRYTDTPVKALGHSYGAWETTVEATCTEDGQQRRDCTRCDHYETRAVAKLGHDYKSVVTAPTCTEDGYTTHTCSRCKDTYTDTPVAALGHSYGEWQTTRAATCTQEGQQRRDCGRCDHYETRAVAELGHDYKAVVTEPTCTEDGYTTHTCSRCKDTYTDTPVAALGHDFGEWETTVEATCTGDGQQRRDCSRCDHFETQAVSKLGHNYESVVTAPTCTEDGYTTYTCTRCGDTYRDDYVDALNHSYEAVVTAPTCLEKGYTTYICTRCGHSYVDNYVEATGHSFGDWYTTAEPTCTEDGQQRRDCSRCDHYETRAVSKLGHDYESVVTAPTCTEQGYTTYTCSRCDDSYVSDYVKALGHGWDEGVVTEEPTEDTPGEMLYTCKRCGETKTEVIPELEHEHRYEAVITAPTCTAKGYTTYTCRCGDSYVSDYVDALGHDYESVVTAPTCTEDGYTTHTCSRCNDSYTDTPVEALGHAFGEWETTVEATCTEDGEQRRNCSRCDHFETQAVSKLGHDYKSTVTDPTCTEDGYTTHTCSRCGDSYTDSYTAALKHSYEAVVTAPTCLDRGYTTYTCSRCGESYVSDYVNALGHAFGEWKTTVEATCTEDGQQRRDCFRCDHFETQAVSKLGHNYESVVTAPTCTEGGYTTHTCSRCKDTYTDTPVAALGHDWDEGVVTVEPTEDTAGEMLYTCERCGETKTEVIPELGHSHSYEAATTAPTCTERGYTTYTCRCGDSYVSDYVDALGHDYKSVVTAPTCTGEGYTTHTCSRCNDSYTDTPVAALGHAFGEWETTVEATCTEDGEQRRDCGRCNHFEIQAVSKLGHNYESVVTAPTCTEEGYTTHTCSRCGDSYTDTPVAALGHDWDDGKVTVEPTEDTAGEMLYTCERCGETKTEGIPELGHEHSYEAVVTAPTCTERGYTTYTCRCGDSYVSDYVDAMGHDFGDWETTVAATCTEDGQQRRECARCGHIETQTVEALGHDYVDGICTRCGAKDPDYEEPTPGTANVIRLSGKDRYLTAFAVANRLKELMGVPRFDTVIVAYGQNFPDALTGSYLAAVKNAPILLTEPNKDALVLEYISENLTSGGKVYILGGTAAVSENFENSAKEAGFDVVRLKGKGRYETNLEILKEAGVNETDEILIATGTNFADSLSASATKLPMLLVGPGLTAEQKDFLATTSRKFVIIGGTGAVNEAVEAELAQIGTVERIKGKTRYETSVVIAERYFTDPAAAVLAYAQGFPDGLCGGPLAMNMDAPLILTSNEAPTAADAYIEGITVGAVTGGTGRITDDTVRAIFDLAEGTEIPIP